MWEIYSEICLHHTHLGEGDLILALPHCAGSGLGADQIIPHHTPTATLVSLLHLHNRSNSLSNNRTNQQYIIINLISFPATKSVTADCTRCLLLPIDVFQAVSHFYIHNCFSLSSIMQNHSSLLYKHLSCI